MRKAYFSPIANDTNRYVGLQQSLLRACGFDVLPFNFRTLFSRKVLGLLSKDNAVVVHWLENRPFAWRDGQARITPKGLAEFMVYLLVMVVARARVVVHVHNHAVHDTSGWRQRLSVGLIRLLQRVADVSVVHDPASAGACRAVYLPHPLYGAPALGGQKLAASGDRPLRCGLLGAVRPYKGIHELLEVWTADAPLLIRGRSTPDYEARLRSVISRRSLQAVDFVSGYLSDDDFGRCLDEIDVLLLPHQQDSMLVSGAFFEGIGRVPAIVARRSAFTAWAASQLPGVHTFDDTRALPALLAGLQPDPRQADISLTAQAAEAMFGWQACLDAYQEFHRTRVSR